MPSVVRSNRWFFRITTPHEFAEAKMPRVLEWIDLKTLLVATHVGDKKENPHIHGVIELTTALQKQSFDVRLKTLFAVKGNEMYSSKEWDGMDGACSYLFHEKTANIIANKGYSDQDIEKFKKLNQDVQQIVEINKARASHRHVDKIIQKMNESGRKWTRMEILEEFVLRIRNGEMYDPGDFMLKRYIEEIMIKQITEEREMTNYVHDRYYSLYRT